MYCFRENDLSAPSPFQGEGWGGGYLSYTHQPRNPVLKEHSRQLRQNMTDVERKLWQHLRGKQFAVKFRRQYPIGSYIVDFVCLGKRFIIELDGGQHSDQHQYDFKRDSYLRAQGFTVLRLWNHEVMENMEGVLKVIWDFINPTSTRLPVATPTLTLPLRGGGDKRD